MIANEVGESGVPFSLFPSPITAVKAYATIGQNTYYDEEFSSFDHNAPLVFLDPSDSQACPDCCKGFSPSFSVPLSPLAASLVVNRTVLLRNVDLEKCSPTIGLVQGFEHMLVALEAAGARAVIVVTLAVVPSWCVPFLSVFFIAFVTMFSNA